MPGVVDAAKILAGRERSLCCCKQFCLLKAKAMQDMRRTSWPSLPLPSLIVPSGVWLAA